MAARWCTLTNLQITRATGRGWWATDRPHPSPEIDAYHGGVFNTRRSHQTASPQSAAADVPLRGPESDRTTVRITGYLGYKAHKQPVQPIARRRGPSALVSRHAPPSSVSGPGRPRNPRTHTRSRFQRAHGAGTRAISRRPSTVSGSDRLGTHHHEWTCDRPPRCGLSPVKRAFVYEGS